MLSTKEKQRIARINSALSSTKYSYVVENSAHSGRSLKEYLLEHSELSSSQINQALSLGGVYINGVRAEQESKLNTPCKIDLYSMRIAASDLSSFFPKITSQNIIFVEQGIAICFKPAGIPSTPAKDQQSFHFKGQIEKLFGCPVHLPSRLDTGVSGLIAVAIEPMAAKALQQCFESRSVKKCYLLLSKKASSWESVSAIGSIAYSPLHAILREINSSGKASQTEFESLGSNKGYTLYRALPRTGRTHQIRLHASSVGIAIAGDNFYQGSDAPQLCLHSYQIALRHPLSQKSIDITTPQNLIPDWLLEHLPISNLEVG